MEENPTHNDSLQSASQAKRYLVFLTVAWFTLNYLTSTWLAVHPSENNTYPEDPFRAHKQIYSQLKEDTDVVIFGNSMSTIAYQPELLKNYLPNTHFYNHGILVGGLTVPHLALKEWLAVRKKPKYILWNIGLFELNGNPSVIAFRGASYVGLSDSPWISQLGSAKYSYFAHAWKNSLSPVSRDYQSWRALLTGKHIQRTRYFDKFGSQPLNNLHTHDMTSDSAVWQKNIQFYKKNITNNFMANNKGIDIIKQFIDECHDKNITLVIACLPACKQYLKLFHQPQDHDWAFSSLQKICNENKITFWDNRNDYTDDHFTDGTHMNQKGAIRFNKDISAQLKSAINK